ncbi:zinc finger MYM-type protein 1-like [Camellia sinensis]|uniref:zinc finger MYM-type protein 1-like n=1 Tax=Camellia sinensis TaxID=4442 RepID=UPI001035C0DD|nr:zinc finger MYM-type protein 1-like [Camellia sinensis]
MNALSLKQAMKNLFSRLGLSISRLRGQGYDGASNMQGEFSGLKTLILKKNPCAYYVHCLAHQLQLALVVVTKNHNQIALLFTLVSNVVSVVGASCKRRDIVKEKQAAKVAEALNNRELSSGQGLNQETKVKHAGDTRWGSHYGTLVSLASMFSTVINVLEMISEDGSNSEQRAEANVLLDSIQSFEFVFNLHLMKTILAITMELMVLNDQLDTYIIAMLSNSEFSIVNGIADFAKKMVETGRDKVYPLVYLLLTLALILPVATATVDRVFSAMNIVKNRLRNRIGDEWMNDSLIVYIERDIFDGIDNDTIMERFQQKKTRWGQL